MKTAVFVIIYVVYLVYRAVKASRKKLATLQNVPIRKSAGAYGGAQSSIEQLLSPNYDPSEIPAEHLRYVDEAEPIEEDPQSSDENTVSMLIAPSVELKPQVVNPKMKFDRRAMKNYVLIKEVLSEPRSRNPLRYPMRRKNS